MLEYVAIYFQVYMTEGDSDWGVLSDSSVVSSLVGEECLQSVGKEGSPQNHKIHHRTWDR